MAEMDIKEVLQYLPHRYPFLLIDKVLECTPGSSLVALKNVTVNEPFFSGHFPNRPIMPAVLILEAMAQATGILALRTLGTMASEQATYYFAGVDKARFRQPVEPGDQLLIEVVLVRNMRSMWKASCAAKVNGALVASADLLGALKGLDG